jgi:hypothetical protein
MLVNEAIDLERDETLQAEVFQYRNMRRTLAEKAEVLGRLCHEFEDMQHDMRNSLKALSAANAFKRIKPHVQYEVAIDDTLPVNARLTRINKMNDPWAEGLLRLPGLAITRAYIWQYCAYVICVHWMHRTGMP